jgi:hypothetical protein
VFQEAAFVLLKLGERSVMGVSDGIVTKNEHNHKILYRGIIIIHIRLLLYSSEANAASVLTST